MKNVFSKWCLWRRISAVAIVNRFLSNCAIMCLRDMRKDMRIATEKGRCRFQKEWGKTLHHWSSFSTGISLTYSRLQKFHDYAAFFVKELTASLNITATHQFRSVSTLFFLFVTNAEYYSGNTGPEHRPTKCSRTIFRVSNWPRSRDLQWE